MSRTTSQSAQNSLNATVMIVDDQMTSRLILETITKSIASNIEVRSFDNAETALELARQQPPNLVLADVKMPHMDGIEFTRQLRSLPNCHDIPIVIITIYDDRTTLYKALDAGATDFLRKPVDHYECKVRCRNLLAMNKQQLIIRNRASSLESQVHLATEAIHTREKETLYRLARAGEFRENISGRRLLRMGQFSVIIARALGLPEDECRILEFAAPMHDIGKIGIPDAILKKPDRLTTEEFEVMKNHTTIGYEILKDSPSPYLQMGAIIALNHHEKYDGHGYPNGLKGEDIPLVARIAAVADVFDALISKRSYKDAWPRDDAYSFIKIARGAHLDPACVDAFVENYSAIADCCDEFENLSIPSVAEFSGNY
ncbi:two-component system response regulator RpfG [Methylohalomonas lacus]|uniref:Two-component system response regulator RpfG n=1 Tax=Methylohalomonas lacus TaxID=398773 RepID=A0AAE3HK18_9GAMM|nr:HD domain-containing phosphohydrolase [Methylohalomonas lacus]MCS3903769.1 two-component system response regulator RpfG [Methylohalomonas lacus]